jgi:hypothetical protein
MQLQHTRKNQSIDFHYSTFTVLLHLTLHDQQQQHITMTSFSNGEKQDWLLDVFRYSDARGWEKQIPVHMMEDANDNRHALQPCAIGTPKAGYVFIRCYRLKLSLTDSQGRIHTEVVRRHDCLLFSSNNRLRSVVLKFPSLQDCVEFSARLMHLNRSLLVAPVSSTTKKNTRVTPGLEENPSMGMEQELQRNETISQMARLLYNPEFQLYVDKVEQLVCDAGLLGSGGALTSFDSIMVNHGRKDETSMSP